MPAPQRKTGDEGLESQIEGDDGDESTDVDKNLEARLTSIESDSQAQAMLTRLVADPEIAEVMARKQRGEKIRIVVGDTPDPKEDAEPEDVDSLSQKDFTKYLLKKVEKTIRAGSNEGIERISQRLGGIESFLGENQEKEVKKEMAEIEKADPKGFAALKPIMREINAKTPGLPLRELYALARMRKGLPITPPTGSESERPRDGGPRGTSQEKKRASRERQQPAFKPGRQGFNDLVSKVLDEKDFDTSDDFD